MVSALGEVVVGVSEKHGEREEKKHVCVMDAWRMGEASRERETLTIKGDVDGFCHCCFVAFQVNQSQNTTIPCHLHTHTHTQT